MHGYGDVLSGKWATADRYNLHCYWGLGGSLDPGETVHVYTDALGSCDAGARSSAG